jgi:hypothetical protein
MKWGDDWLNWFQRLEFATVAAATITVVCLMIGQGAERYAASPLPTAIALDDQNAAPTKPEARRAPSFNAIDYATTGALKGRTVVISPCSDRDVAQ